MAATELQPVTVPAFGEVATHSIDQVHARNGIKPQRTFSNASDGTVSAKSEENVEAQVSTKTFGHKLKRWLRENIILIFTLIGVTVGIVLGVVLKAVEAKHGKISPEWRALISFPGDILMRMLKCLIVPLVTSSLVSGLGQLDLSLSASMARRAFTYYFGTNIIAVILGIIVVVIIHPGSPAVKSSTYEILDQQQGDLGLSTLDAMLDLVRNLFPENIVQTAFMFQSTVYSKKKVKVPIDTLNGNITSGADVITETNNITQEVRRFRVEDRLIPALVEKYGVNMLGLIIFFLAFGFVLASLRDDNARIVTAFFTCINDITMKLIMLVMWYSPIGIGSLIAGRIVVTDNLIVLLASLARLVGTVTLGLSIHGLVVLPIIFFICTRRNPYIFMKGMFQAWLIGLATASSAASIPFSLRCLEVNNKVDSRVSRFVVPVGATVNMNGTALYEAIACIFIGQVNNIPMPIGKLITISITATLAAIGAAAVPGAGLVTLIIVLTSVGLPVQDISLVVAVDWLLDRLRTSINVMDDAMGAGIVYYMSKSELERVDAVVAAAEAVAAAERLSPRPPSSVLPTNPINVVASTIDPVHPNLVHRRASHASINSHASSKHVESRC